MYVHVSVVASKDDVDLLRWATWTQTVMNKWCNGHWNYSGVISNQFHYLIFFTGFLKCLLVSVINFMIKSIMIWLDFISWKCQWRKGEFIHLRLVTLPDLSCSFKIAITANKHHFNVMKKNTSQNSLSKH